MSDRWEDSAAYERYMGRWSRRLARQYVRWLSPDPGLRWLDVGCGTGALTAAILEGADPETVTACDTAADYVDYCRANIEDPRLEVRLAAVEALPVTSEYDTVASSLVLNFMPAPAAALSSMGDVCVQGGTVTACVWDYSEGMEFLRTFWDAAVSLHPDAVSVDEGRRFPLCRPDALAAAFAEAGLRDVVVESLTIDTEFADFDDYWAPFLSGPGPAPGFVRSLSPGDADDLAARLRDRLFRDQRGPVSMRARAWAARGRVER